MVKAVGPSSSKHLDKSDRLLAADLAKHAGPFRNPPDTALVDLAKLPAGRVRTQLEEAAQRLPRAGGDNGYLQGVYAVSGDAKSSRPIGYAVIAYGGTERGAWSSAEYFDLNGRSVGTAHETD